MSDMDLCTEKVTRSDNDYEEEFLRGQQQQKYIYHSVINWCGFLGVNSTKACIWFPSLSLILTSIRQSV
jgi:hypothetical protein